MNGTITLESITKKFGNQDIINNLSMTIPGGSFTCLFGKSGQGKSVLLKIIIGLLEPSSGSVSIDGKEAPKVGTVNHDGVSIGYVFQFAALLDSLTICENITITCDQLLSPEAKRHIAHQALIDVGLHESALDKYPSELSGGMKKRVGIARTLVQRPRIILYDEPTTGLDPLTTKQIHEVMKNVQVKHGVTTVVVSHDMGIIPFSDYIGILENGTCNFFAPTQQALAIKHPFLESFLEAGYPSKSPDFYSESFLT
jgi:phospholipid/cholesterol/gamma-HCH transport system ATP-binding protein